MKPKITASIFALTTATLLAQPTLPTTNSFLVPIANPYSASWIYYTTNPASGLDFLNGASIPFVMTASNNIVNSINTATTGLAGTNYVNAMISNLATTNFVLSQGYVTGSVTNGLATTSFVTSQGYVTAAITNGLATTSFALSIGANNTNNTLSVSNLVYLAAQSYANNIGANGTNYTTSVSNSLATQAAGVVTWGTTTNKTGGAAPATVYYYFANGQPMFGVISTNN